jgi:hypothetical protein
MRLTILSLIGAVALTGTAMSAKAAPIVAEPAADHASGIVQVWGGCGQGGRPVPGHWSPWRGVWVPPHCVPNYYGGYRVYYGGGYPYWHHHRYYRWGY